MIDVNIFIAFMAGLVSFIAPCIIPLVPAYISYVAGVSSRDLKEKGFAFYRNKIILSSLFYILGFSSIFVILGTVAASISAVIIVNTSLIQKIGGLFMIILGLEFAGIFHLSFLQRGYKLKIPSWAERFGYLRAFLVGVVFATAWTPCVGVVLGSILTLAAVSQTAVVGATLLFFYSLGISLPFFILSVLLASAPKHIKFFSKYSHRISRISGVVFALIGLMLFTNTYRYLNGWLFEVAFKLGYKIK